jgi:hypothetical protein
MYVPHKLSGLSEQHIGKIQEVSLAHLAREVDVQPSHPGSSPHRREFGFLFSKNQNRCRGFPYRISYQKKFGLSPIIIIINNLSIVTKYVIFGDKSLRTVISDFL